MSNTSQRQWSVTRFGEDCLSPMANGCNLKMLYLWPRWKWWIFFAWNRSIHFPRFPWYWNFVQQWLPQFSKVFCHLRFWHQLHVQPVSLRLRWYVRIQHWVVAVPAPTLAASILLVVKWFRPNSGTPILAQVYKFSFPPNLALQVRN